jgi:hypothetical protein
MRAQTTHSTTSAPDPSAVLTKAVLRAAEALNVSDAHLATVIGVSASSLSRMRSAARTIDPSTKEGELALAFVRMYRSLNALLGNTASCRAWFHAENTHLRGVPAALVRKVEGLVDVIQYLDAMRGKV